LKVIGNNRCSGVGGQIDFRESIERSYVEGIR